jgi:hypothetical protein
MNPRFVPLSEALSIFSRVAWQDNDRRSLPVAPHPKSIELLKIGT